MSECTKPKGYKFKVNKEKYISEEKLITGRKILEIAGICDVEKVGLYIKIKGKGMERIDNLECDIDLSKKGVERFVTLPLEQQEGEIPHRILQLPPDDEEYLNSSGLRWEVVEESAVRWLVIHDYPIPPQYNFQVSDISLRLESCYPDTQIDMVYFSNHLSLPNKQIGALCDDAHLKRNWQRWSRHRTGAHPWRIGVDCIETHMALVDYWLEREIS